MKTRIIALALVACALCGCTPAEATTATKVATVVEDGCLLIVSIAAPADAPLCVDGEELAAEVIAYIASHAGTAPAVATSGGRTIVAADLYASLSARPGVKARASKPRCPKPAGGTVAP